MTGTSLFKQEQLQVTGTDNTTISYQSLML